MIKSMALRKRITNCIATAQHEIPTIPRYGSRAYCCFRLSLTTWEQHEHSFDIRFDNLQHYTQHGVLGIMKHYMKAFVRVLGRTDFCMIHDSLRITKINDLQLFLNMLTCVLRCIAPRGEISSKSFCLRFFLVRRLHVRTNSIQVLHIPRSFFVHSMLAESI